MTTEHTTAAASHDPRLDRFADPDTLPDAYAAPCHGQCMDPEIPDGTVMVFDRRQVPKPGDLVGIWFRRDALASVRDYQQSWGDNPRRPALNAATERNDALENERHEAEKTVWTIPAPDLGALAWKIEAVLEEVDRVILYRERVASTLADVRRLLRGDAA